tara:strand:- start:11098 stop:11484 length:387 start_codon:yes stop_codon:yes gene_type:complete
VKVLFKFKLTRSEEDTMNKLFPLIPRHKPAERLDGIVLCQRFNTFLNKKYFVALTGGLIFQQGERKDIDIIIYRNRETDKFEMLDIQDILIEFGFIDIRFYGFVTKCKWQGYDVDIMHPEATTGEYPR